MKTRTMYEFEVKDVLEILLSNNVKLEELVEKLSSHYKLSIKLIQSSSTDELYYSLVEETQKEDNENINEELLSSFHDVYPFLEEYINNFLTAKGFEVKPGKFDFSSVIIAWSNFKEIR
jgi:hypothetical protein